MTGGPSWGSFSATVVDEAIVPEATATVEFGLRNTSDESVEYSEMSSWYRSVENDPGLTVVDTASERKRAESRCWKLANGAIHSGGLVTVSLEPGEQYTERYDVYAQHDQSAACIVPGSYEFDLPGLVTLAVEETG